MRRFALLLFMTLGVVLAGATYPTRWNAGGGGSTYVSTLAGSILIGDGAGGYTEETGVVVDSTGFITLASYLTATGAPFASGGANTTSYGGTGVRIEGAADANEGLISYTAPASDWTITVGADGQLTLPGLGAVGTELVRLDGVNGGFYAAGATSINVAVAGSSSRAVFWQDGQFQAAGRILALGGSFLTYGAHEADPADANLASWGRAGAAWEGTTNDANEGQWTIADPSGDWTLATSAAGNFAFPGDITSTDTGDAGWTVQSAADQACSTTCTSGAAFGQDTTTGNIVGPGDASADRCVCLGAS